MNTSCEKCIFADYANSEEPCKMNIIDQIKQYHNISISENNFYSISDYYCRYGFDLNRYDQHKEEIGTIEDLKNTLINRAKVKYYLVIDVKDASGIPVLCKTINRLTIPPQFISFIFIQQNNTDIIINNIKNILNPNIGWKIHNFLEDTDLTNSISVIFDTNAGQKDTVYFWINSDTNFSSWNNEIIKINNILYIDQPKCHALFRSKNKDGLFLSFNQYKEMKIHLNSDIFKAINLIENPQFIYYA